MKRISTKEWSAVLLLAAACVAPKSHAQGTLQITFDGPPLQPPGSDYAVTNYSESGISFTPIPGSPAFGRVFPGVPAAPQNGTAYIRTLVADSLMFRFTDASQFGVISVDLAEYNSAANYPVTVQFIGFYGDGSTVTTSFTTDGIIDGAGPLADFQTFYFDEKWTGLTRVKVPGYGWSLDNLVISVPEPGTCALLIAGGLLLWARSGGMSQSRR